jgi:5-methylthioadenosine/S-adenosylhomocysteine deaminase
MTALPRLLSGDDLLLEPAKVLLPDGVAEGLAVVVTGGRFRRIAPVAAVRAEFPHLVPVPLPGRLLMPGLIDAHTHLTQALGKALAFGEPSEIFRRIWVPMEASLRPQAAFTSARLAALEALRGGFTTVVDAGTRSSDAIQGIAGAVREVGIRCVLALTCNDLARADAPAPPEPMLRAAEAHLAHFAADPLLHPSLAVSIPEVASDAMLTRVAALCREAGRIFQTHANEHLVAVERSLVARGLRPIELLAACDALNERTLLAHATLLTPHELRLLQSTGAAVAYNPVASQWKGNAVCDALTLQAQGVPFALGTDGTRYDGFRLLDAAEATQRIAFGLARGDSSAGGGWTWLDHATHRAAPPSAWRASPAQWPRGSPPTTCCWTSRSPNCCPAGISAGNWCGWRTGARSRPWSWPGACACGKAGRSTGMRRHCCAKSRPWAATTSRAPRSSACTLTSDAHRRERGHG